ncbi:MAG: LPS export ABC transporter permease LptF [Sedimenticola sp.]|uniref:Lipopolysaccharide export system permease protein LptF n=1 Tax=Sedimenticola thiotaurini TaxID=1543721 RepID=A0A558CVA3_9GAMM|nr:LPS export ABC transporter permease LptF [Sedimenticola sp.]TVT52653.1 MAG: LPS export ABC transporter permease LptF [Sedimenticola thiotaurini]MCW8882729.1 LPS export ABC transporter permease LptF [Sedimenticola sp.]MCW8946744.1 LPS export ABC transporter permease LptF [Sedimenticola sp.]MCW8948595.1 LPS export ABC transporter permease LptF [Sedimenticola sp.]
MLPIIDRYILREVSKSFFAVMTVLMLIVVSQSYIRILQDAVSGAITNEVMTRLLGLEVLQVLGPVTPPTFFFAILYTLGRMYRDSEMTALAAGGVGLKRIYRAFALAAIPVALLVAWFTLGLVPWVNANKAEIMNQQKDESAELGMAVAGRFNEFSKGGLVFYVEKMSDDKRRMRNIFVQNRQHGKLGLITAAEGHQYIEPDTGDQYLVLSRGHRYEGTPGNNEYAVGDFAKYAILIDKGDQQAGVIPSKAIPTRDLIGSDDLHLQAELELRLMFPVAVLVFTILSVPLSKSMPREGIYGRLMLALLFYVLFLNLQAVSGNWMTSGATPAWLGRWWVHPFMLLLGAAVMLYKSPRMSRVLQARLRRKLS